MLALTLLASVSAARAPMGRAGVIDGRPPVPVRWRGAAPTPQQRALVDAAARDLRLRAVWGEVGAQPALSTRETAAASETARVERWEAQLAAARLAADTDGAHVALTLLAELERDLRSAAALPEAGPLLAELRRLRGRVLERSGEGAAAAREYAAASALGGPLAPELGAAVHTPPSTLPVRLVGRSAADQVEVDGVQVPHGEGVQLAEGEHHVRVLRRARLVGAAFVTVVEGALTLPAPQLQPCEAAALELREPPCPRFLDATGSGTSVGVWLHLAGQAPLRLRLPQMNAQAALRLHARAEPAATGWWWWFGGAASLAAIAVTSAVLLTAPSAPPSAAAPGWRYEGPR